MFFFAFFLRAFSGYHPFLGVSCRAGFPNFPAEKIHPDKIHPETSTENGGLYWSKNPDFFQICELGGGGRGQWMLVARAGSLVVEWPVCVSDGTGRGWWRLMTLVCVQVRGV